MAKEIPAGYRAHQESTTEILIKATTDKTEEAFINPVQEYNRDLSITVIRAWSTLRSRELEAKKLKPAQGKLKNKRPISQEDANNESQKKIKTEEAPTDTAETTTVDTITARETTTPPSIVPRKFTALEALSATGLRAIRYAKEIPSLKWIIANDLSPSAVAAIKLNITHNGLDDGSAPGEGRVRVTQGDACDLMYAHRPIAKQVDVVDLDPYGSAAPFIDAALQCVKDGGLLCVTCTDLAVLAGHAYPEKCFSNYGGSSMRAEYSHEYALRQVIHGLASSAARYGKSVKPILSLSIDFYVRIFVRVYHSPAEVKKLVTNTALVYVCSGCAAHHFQPLGRSASKPTKSGTAYHVSYHNAAGPPVSSGSQCEECDGKLHVAGPLWAGPLHDGEFAQQVLDDVDQAGTGLKTAERIKGMVRIAKTEIPDSAFYFTPAKLSGLFKCSSPSLTTVGSALINAGYRISRSHCAPGSIKTDAPRRFIYDLMKKWIESTQKKTPVDPALPAPAVDGENLQPDHVSSDKQHQETGPPESDQNDQKLEPSGQPKPDLPHLNQPAALNALPKPLHHNPTAELLSRPAQYQVDLTFNKKVAASLLLDTKIVRYQANPTPNWGPKPKALH